MRRRVSHTGLCMSQAGQQQEVTEGPSVEERTGAVTRHTHAGRSKSSTRAVEKHNQSSTGKPLPADFVAVVEAWDDLPDAIRRGVLAMVEAVRDGRR